MGGRGASSPSDNVFEELASKASTLGAPCWGAVWTLWREQEKGLDVGEKCERDIAAGG